MIPLILALYVISYVAKAAKDTLAHHYSTSIFAGLNPQFWDPIVSWKNKYKDGDPRKGNKFFLSSTWLVFLTDGWHLMQFIELRTKHAVIGLLIYLITEDYQAAIVWSGLLELTGLLTFEKAYRSWLRN